MKGAESGTWCFAMPDQKVLILNCGSSSIKCKIAAMPQYEVLASVDISRIGLSYSEIQIRHKERQRVFQETVADHEEGISRILRLISEELNVSLDEIALVGHRVVHGGKMRESAFVEESLIEYLKEIADMAPLHNPAHIAGMLACSKEMPDVPQVAVFDNGYHQTLSKSAFTYAIPYQLAEKHKIRKYGFHGIAFRSMLESSKWVLNSDLKDQKTVLLMLGSGTTANACINGISMDVSTGFTPHEGLIQSTRSGDIDAAAYTYLMKKEGLSVEEVEDLMNRKGGWAGISGLSSDLREIHTAALQGDERAQTAIDALCHRIKKYIGGYAAILGGIDLLVFGGGVGEHAWYVREQVCRDMGFLGLELDQEKNEKKNGPRVISANHSKAKILVVAVDEEKIIAQDAFQMVQEMQNQHP